MRPKIKTQFFEGIESINGFAMDLLKGKIILCETLSDCAAAVKQIENGLYDNYDFEEVTLFIMPELEIELLAHKDHTDRAVEEIKQLLNAKTEKKP
jgi:hypothetical protein